MPLTPHEDQALRRLVFFEELGAVLAPQVLDLREALRARDRRSAVRLPVDEHVLQPA